MGLLVFPAAIAVMFGIAFLHLSLYGYGGTKLIGVVPAATCILGFFGAVLICMAVANFIPGPQSWQALWDRVFLQAGGLTLREMSRRTLRPFALTGLTLVLVSVLMALIPGAW
jgi:hypothetical protein